MKKKNLIMFFFLRKMSPCGSSILQEEIKGMFRTFRRRKGEVFDIEREYLFENFPQAGMST